MDILYFCVGPLFWQLHAVLAMVEIVPSVESVK